MTHDSSPMRAPETIETPRLCGRRVGADDLEYIVAVDADWRIQKTLFGIVQTRDDSRARHGRWLRLWDDFGLGFWIFRNAAGEEIGHAGLFPSPRSLGSVEFGYVVKPEHWNNGYATEMATAVLAVGFDLLELSRVVANAQASNAASRNVMQKCGLMLECEYLYDDGSPSVRYAVDRERWMRRR